MTKKLKISERNIKETYGHEPDQFATQAYDGIYLYAQALKNAGSNDRDICRDALAEIKDFEGILGNFSFDKRATV